MWTETGRYRSHIKYQISSIRYHVSDIKYYISSNILIKESSNCSMILPSKKIISTMTVTLMRESRGAFALINCFPQAYLDVGCNVLVTFLNIKYNFPGTSRENKITQQVCTAGTAICYSWKPKTFSQGRRILLIRDVPGGQILLIRDVPGGQIFLIRDVPGGQILLIRDVPGGQILLIRDVPDVLQVQVLTRAQHE